MDPNTCYEELQSLFNREGMLCSDEIDRMHELAESLYGWLAGGGFLPKTAESSGLNRAGLMRFCIGLSKLYAF